MDTISKLSPVTFTWNHDLKKDSTTRLQRGLIAQEIGEMGLGGEWLVTPEINLDQSPRHCQLHSQHAFR